MPLYEGACDAIRANLETIALGRKARLIIIGCLTDAQLAAVNALRSTGGYPHIEPEVVFLGQHTHNSRILRDGYTIEDVIDQISSGLDSTSEVISDHGMTALECAASRRDRYGNSVKDRVVLECSVRYPKPELFSVIPKGDVRKPKKKAVQVA
jgi:hypothetical protein